MTLRRSFSTPAVAALLLGALPFSARADDFHHHEAKIASGSGNLAYLALGTFLPLATDNGAGGRHTLRNGDAVVTTALLTEGLKALTRERRPDGSDRSSFPSGHASAAFAIAAMQAHWHPSEAPLWYLGAALIGESRVTLKRHYWHDVIVGAALGIGIASVEWHQPRGLLISPIYPGNGGSGRSQAPGISFSRSF